jgi:hypothetical protein
LVGIALLRELHPLMRQAAVVDVEIGILEILNDLRVLFVHVRRLAGVTGEV